MTRLNIYGSSVLPPVAASVALGWAIASSPTDDRGRALVVLSAVAAVPLLVLGLQRRPAVFAGFITLAVIFEGLEVRSPLGTLSPAIAMALIFLVSEGRQATQLAVTSGSLSGVLAAGLALYVGGQLVAFGNVAPETAVRGLVTTASFAVFWLVGTWIAESPRRIRGSVVGGTIGLLVLATIALAVSKGYVAAPPRIGDARTLLGFTSPFDRNYGLPVDYPTIGFLFAFTVAGAAAGFATTRHRIGRLFYAAALLLITPTVLLFFQSRSMLLGSAIALSSAVLLAQRGRQWLLWALIVVTVLVLTVGASLAGGSAAESSQLRTESFHLLAREIGNTPSILLVGTDPQELGSEINLRLRSIAEIPEAAPIHNVFFENIIRYGALSTLGLILLFVTPAFMVTRQFLTTGHVTESGVLSVVMVITLGLEATINPAIANVSALWMGLGLAAALAQERLS